jgi:vacuole morphology and inheritance protein 14
LLTLCLLSQSYQHAAELVLRLPEIDITVDLLKEIDRLVQLIESPILAYVRLDLLSAEHQRSLACVLSALLMLLPQTDAFNTLVKRLQVIPLLTITDNHKKSNKEKPTKIKFKELLEFFDNTIATRTKALSANHKNKLNSRARQVEN